MDKNLEGSSSTPPQATRTFPLLELLLELHRQQRPIPLLQLPAPPSLHSPHSLPPSLPFPPLLFFAFCLVEPDFHLFSYSCAFHLWLQSTCTSQQSTLPGCELLKRFP